MASSAYEEFELSEKSLCAILSEAVYHGHYNHYTKQSKIKSWDRIKNELNKWTMLPKWNLLESNQDMFAIEIRNKLYFSCRGTEKKDIRDIGNDVANIATGITMGKRVKTTKENVIRIVNDSKKYGKDSIVLCGHSLGGYVAESVAVELDYVAITFNAPGQISLLKVVPIVRHFTQEFPKSDKIMSYIIKCDIVGNYGTRIGKYTIENKAYPKESAHSLIQFIKPSIQAIRNGAKQSDLDLRIQEEKRATLAGK